MTEANDLAAIRANDRSEIVHSDFRAPAPAAPQRRVMWGRQAPVLRGLLAAALIATACTTTEDSGVVTTTSARESQASTSNWTDTAGDVMAQSSAGELEISSAGVTGPLNELLEANGELFDVSFVENDVSGQTTITAPAETPEAGEVVMFHYWDDDVERWRPEVTSFDAATGLATTTVDHLTIWNPFTWCWSCAADRLAQAVQELQGNRTSPPECSGSAPEWFKEWFDDAAASAPFTGCAEREGDTLVMRVVNNRPYSIVVTSEVGFAWSSNDTTVPWNDALREALGPEHFLRSGDADWMYLPPASTARIAFNEPDPKQWSLEARADIQLLIADLVGLAISETIGSQMGTAESVFGVVIAGMAKCGVINAVDSPPTTTTAFLSALRELASCFDQPGFIEEVLAGVGLDPGNADFTNLRAGIKDFFRYLDVAEYAGKFADIVVDAIVEHEYGLPQIGLVRFRNSSDELEPQQGVLTSNGVGSAQFGDDEDSAGAELVDLFGVPTRDSGWERLIYWDLPNQDPFYSDIADEFDQVGATNISDYPEVRFLCWQAAPVETCAVFMGDGEGRRWFSGWTQDSSDGASPDAPSTVEGYRAGGSSASLLSSPDIEFVGGEGGALHYRSNGYFGSLAGIFPPGGAPDPGESIRCIEAGQRPSGGFAYYCGVAFPQQTADDQSPEPVGGCRETEQAVFVADYTNFGVSICFDGSGLVYRGVKLIDGVGIELPACAATDGGEWYADNNGFSYVVNNETLRVFDPDGVLIVDDLIFDYEYYGEFDGTSC